MEAFLRGVRRSVGLGRGSPRSLGESRFKTQLCEILMRQGLLSPSSLPPGDIQKSALTVSQVKDATVDRRTRMEGAAQGKGWAKNIIYCHSLCTDFGE